jgi:protein-tyrosine-phosphatase
MSSRSNVLVVCVHNAGRSQMAAGIDIAGQVPRKLEWRPPSPPTSSRVGWRRYRTAWAR